MKAAEAAPYHYIIPSDNWEQQRMYVKEAYDNNYIIPSDNWEQQLLWPNWQIQSNYIIPSDNWEQQLNAMITASMMIISYQAITGNNNGGSWQTKVHQLYHTKR